MAKQCELTGKKPLKGHNVSHANNKTHMRQHPNLRTKRYSVPGLGTVTLTLSTSAIKTIDKLGGLARAVSQVAEKGLSDRLVSIKRRLQAVKSQASKQA